MIADEKIGGLYVSYNTVIKPLIAELEARLEHFPLPLFNEIRALHDHIARCFAEGTTERQIEEETNKAQRHQVRIMLDCYKYLNLAIHESLESFEHQTRNVDLTVLNNGAFYPEYKLLKAESVRLVRAAKRLEAIDTAAALEKYQEAFNSYASTEALADSVATDVHWARQRFTLRRGLSILLWLASAVASGVISVLIAEYM